MAKGDTNSTVQGQGNPRQGGLSVPWNQVGGQQQRPQGPGQRFLSGISQAPQGGSMDLYGGGQQRPPMGFAPQMLGQQQMPGIQQPQSNEQDMLGINPKWKMPNFGTGFTGR